jgi:hypothetical protein
MILASMHIVLSLMGWGMYLAFGASTSGRTVRTLFGAYKILLTMHLGDRYILFRCHQLQGYEEAIQRVLSRGEHTIEQVCKSLYLGFEYD